jgi:hypothetical protein
MRWITLTLVYCTIAGAQVPTEDISSGSYNCRYWNNVLPESTRAYFIAGFGEGNTMFAGTEKKFIWPNATNGEIVTGVTRICAQPENLRIWIWSAIAAFRDQLNGATQQAVEESLRRARILTTPQAK